METPASADSLSDDNPTQGIELDFATYVAKHKGDQRVRTIGDVPTYSFALDGILRQRIAAMGPVRSVARLLVSSSAPLYRQINQMYNLMVGPHQFSEIHEIGKQCARKLGIGVPQIFIEPAGETNAFTISTDDLAPVIVLTQSLVSLMKADNDGLAFIIGHECGHIHNLHGVYNTAAEMLVNPTARVALQKLLSVGVPINMVRLLAGTLQSSMRLFLMHWSRCAEITCDRAGLICSGSLATAERAMLKLAIGDADLLAKLNVEVFLEQLDHGSAPSLTTRLLQLNQTHPLIQPRIKALRVFADSEVFAQWAPDSAAAQPSYSREEADRICEQLLGVSQ